MNSPMRRALGVLFVLCFATFITAGAAYASSTNSGPSLTAVSAQAGIGGHHSPGAAAPMPADLVVNEPFPTAGDAYCSATNGCGTIPAGGSTAFQWTAGDFVQSAVFTNTGITSLEDLSLSWTAIDDLAAGQQENWEIFANGVDTGFFAFVNCSGSGYCSGNVGINGTINFSNIAPVAGGYQIEIIESNTIASGAGSIAWNDGGTTGLSQSTPEPNSMVLLGTGLVLAGALWRKLS